MCQFFEFLILSRDFWGSVHYVREINLTALWNMVKAFYLLRETNKNKFETCRICRRKTAEDDNIEIYVSPNIPCNILLIFQIFFQRKTSFKFYTIREMECQ